MHKFLFVIICFMFSEALGAGLANAIHFKKSDRSIGSTVFIALACFLGIGFLTVFLLYHIIALLPNSDYWYTITYTICFALMSKNEFYESIKKTPTSFGEAFRIGFTKSVCSRYILTPPTRSTIHLFYLAVLIIGQLLDLNMISLPQDIEQFVLLNKYGLVIIYAIEKILADLPKERAMLDITSEAENVVIQKRKDDGKELTDSIKGFFKRRRPRRKKRK